MKKILRFFILLIILLVVTYTIGLLIRNHEKKSIQIDENEISQLNNAFKSLPLNWEKNVPSTIIYIDSLKTTTKIKLLQNLNITTNSLKILNKNILDNSSIYIKGNSLTFLVYSTSDLTLFFPDSYLHYISYNSQGEILNKLSKKGNEIVKSEALNDKLKYVIVRKFWD